MATVTGSGGVTVQGQTATAKVAVNYQQVVDAVTAVTNLTRSMDRMVGKVNRVRQATSKNANSMKGVTAATNKSASAMDIFNKSSQDLTKSVQVALGPLSGVAARITAMTALFNKNSFAAAGLIGMLVGLGVAARKLVSFATQTEVELNRMEAVVGSLGDRAAFTTVELERMAQTLAENTLASVSEAREAITTLATFDNIAPQLFEKATTAAYAFADVMGGQLAASIRQVGVLLEDPIRNIEMLRRRGIQFTDAEKDKIDALMKTGKVMEAQSITLEKFNIYIAQSEAKAKSMAGTFDRTGQLLNNFFEDISRQGNVLGGVGTAFSKVNDALEDLLTNEKFIASWGKTFELAATAVAKGLQFLAENIRVISAILVPVILTISLRAVAAMGAFALSIVRASSALKTLRETLLGLFLLLRVGGIGAAFAAVLGLIASKAILVATVITGLIVGFRAFMGTTEKVSAETVAFGKEIDSLSEKIERLPSDIKIDFESNASNISREIKALQQEVLQLEADRLNAQRRTVMVGMGEFANVPDTDEINRIDQALMEVNARLAEHRGEWEELERSAANATEAARYGISNIQVALKELDSIEKTFLPDISKEKEKKEMLDRLYYQLFEVMKKTQLGLAFIEAGRGEEFFLNLIAAVERGEKSSSKAKDSWKSLADTFEDLTYNVSEAALELQGLTTGLSIPPSLIRQFEALSSGDRNRLAGMGVTPESINKLKTAQEELNELTRFRNNILKDQTGEQQKLNDEVDKVLEMLDRAVGITEEFREETRKLVETYRDSEVASIIKEEEQVRLRSLREIEDMYHHMNVNLMESELSRKDFAIAQVEEELRQKMQYVQEYVNKRAELEGGLNDSILADAAHLRERFIGEYQHKLNVVQDTYDNMRKFAAGAAKAMQDSFSDLLFKPWEKGLLGMVRGFADALHKMAADLLAQQMLLSFLGAMGGTAGGDNFMSTMFRAVTAANGGYIQGPGTGTSDSIPARLSAGEYVINARAVKQIGVNALHSINEGRVAQFSQGGYVGNQQAEMSSAGTRIINVIDPSLVQDYMNSPGGEKVVLNILQRNAGSVRQLVA